MFTLFITLVYCLSLIGGKYLDNNSIHIDGTEQKIRGIDQTYTQHVSIDGQCRAKLAGQENLLNEGEIIKLKNKWFKVEDCLLNRAYPIACQSDLYYQLRDLACGLVSIGSKRNVIDRLYKNACCHTVCTVSELVQSCSTEIDDF